MTKAIFRFYYLFFGLIFAWAFLYDLLINVNRLIDFFSYFTVFSILFAAVLFLWIGFYDRRKGLLGFSFDEVRGAVLAYIIISAVIYQFTLSGRPEIKPVFWINFVDHRLAPVVMSLGWILFPLKEKLKLTAIFKWLIFPLFYVAFVFARGAITGWYPYYFFDPSKTSYWQMLIFSVGATGFGLIISLAIIFVGNLLLRPKK